MSGKKDPFTRRMTRLHLRTRAQGFESNTHSTYDHRNAEDGLTGEGLPAFHRIDLERGSATRRSLFPRARYHLGRPPLADEQIIKGGSREAYEKFAEKQAKARTKRLGIRRSSGSRRTQPAVARDPQEGIERFAQQQAASREQIHEARANIASESTLRRVLRYLRDR